MKYLFSALLIVGFYSLGAHATPDSKCDSNSINTTFAGGDGTSQNPYGICSVAQLQHMAQNPNAAYQLWSDLEIVRADLPAQGWEPLFVQTPFGGKLDGLGHTINGLWINRPTQDDVALFSQCGHCIIQNLKMTNVDVTGRYNAAALAGRYVYETSSVTENDNIPMNNIAVTGVLAGLPSVGGVFGNVYNVWPVLTEDIFAKRNVTFDGSVTVGTGTFHSNRACGTFDYD